MINGKRVFFVVMFRLVKGLFRNRCCGLVVRVCVMDMCWVCFCDILFGYCFVNFGMVNVLSSFMILVLCFCVDLDCMVNLIFC